MNIRVSISIRISEDDSKELSGLDFDDYGEFVSAAGVMDVSFVFRNVDQEHLDKMMADTRKEFTEAIQSGDFKKIRCRIERGDLASDNSFVFVDLVDLIELP